MDMAANLDVAAFGALVSGVSGVLVPRIIERVPEPEPETDPAEDGTGDEAGTERRAEHGAGHGPDHRSEPRFEGDAEPERPPKELYADLAYRPGLTWKSVLAAALAGGLAGLALGWDWALLVWLPLVPVGVALAVIDWRTRLLPTWLIARTYALVVVLVLLAFAFTRESQDLVRAAVGWAGAGLLYLVLWFIYPRGLGFGDVRLSGILGIALGYVGTSQLVVGMYAGFLLGGVGGAVLAVLRLVERKGVPFGPFMLVGALLGLLTGDWVGGLTNG